LASQRSKQLQFAALIFVLMAAVFYRWYGLTPSFYWRLTAWSVMNLGLFLLPQLIYPILVLWFLLGKILGEIVSAILLSGLYFLFIWAFKLFVKVDLTPGWKPKSNERDYKNMG
jgi:hypothetical protein